MTQRASVTFLAAVLTCGVLVAQQQAPSPDQPPVTFRVEVDYVEVDAFVTDAQGNPVTNLTAGDFEVLEDGKPQKVTAFSLVNLPIVRAERPLFAATPVESDVQTNEGTEGRIYLIVLDDAHTDPTRGPRVKAAARRFIEQNFGLNDLAAVVYTGGRSQDSQDFTNNSRLLLAAIDKFVGKKFGSETIWRLSNLQSGPNGELVAPDDPANMERAFRARSVMSSIRQLAEFMAGVRGRRKAMILIGEGIDYDIHQVMGQGGTTASSVLQDTHDAIAAATRGNVIIYAIDPRGLLTGSEDLIEVSSTMPDNSLGLQSIMNEQRLSQDSLRVLAANTGGFAAVNRNDFNGVFDRIVSENSTYYLLGYYAANARRDGRYRKIEVRMKRPGLRVRSRSGYYEARGRRPIPQPPTSTSMGTTVAAALGSPLPVAGIGLKVFAAPFKGVAPNAAVAFTVELDATKLDFVEKDGTFTEQIEVAYTATSAGGKVFPGDRHTVNLALKPDTYERVKARGFRVLSQANLPPGRYQMRVAVGSRTGQAGSVLYDLEVPDFQKAPFSMSGVALTSASAAEVTTVKPKDPLREFLPAPASAQREFARGDTIAFFVEFYENLSNAQSHMIAMRAELRAEGGRVVREIADERSSAELQGSAGGYGFGGRLSLDDVEPGLYVLHVEGQARTGNLAMVSRDIQIRVR